MKYLCVWTFGRGANIAQWEALKNAEIRKFVFAEKNKDLLECFNMTTNLWIRKYVYKRLKFLNQRILSFGLSILFLALWHGFYPGYYFAGLNEVMIIESERLWFNIMHPIITGWIHDKPFLQILYRISILFGRFCWSFYAGLPFFMATSYSIKQTIYVYSTIYFVGHVFWIGVIFSLRVFEWIKPKTKKTE